ncbi:hypothetical protein SAMN04488058_10295 [Deinococcus reticulitermitis]|uniref:Uncharacterized protein n=1 Tax=Deinococcus reticulitermitis TaxID=856736 RepID=A0A1H6UFX4_9DEIO|nr:hypothetical protein [Deinococcus reticulitermitis]SEI87025.1 hypothetical protein SAMN04488058_10295 [Deinococcus reticulitermitis]
MRIPLLLGLTLLLSAPALAWVPKLDEPTAKKVIDGVYGRGDLVMTYQTVDLSVKDGKFAAGEGAVTAFDGGPQCVADWLAAPGDTSQGSRLLNVTASGQADQLYFQAIDARDSFKNLRAADALGATYAGARLADGELRVDIQVSGLPTEKARDAYRTRMRGPDGKMIDPVRRSYVADFKQGENGKWTGTLVYYFKPLEAGLGASDRVELLVRTEADTSCAYSVGLNLGSFQ